MTWFNFRGQRCRSQQA